MNRLVSWTCLVFLVFLVSGASVTAVVVAADRDAEAYFETEIRPLLADFCLECHNADSVSGGLVLSSREAVLRGGEHGPAIVPGDADRSLLMKAIRRQGELKMPPDESLNDQQIRALQQWIDSGAYWPARIDLGNRDTALAAQHHWAFQPIRSPTIPNVEDNGWSLNPIDQFIAREIRRQGLTPAPVADARTLLRRATYALTGLPPSVQEVTRATEHPETFDYEAEVERLLQSPHYGEHWARHWLDVARYSDTKGYVYAREERFWTHAWAYRDWVVRAFNQDLPYDRFLLLQLAADQVDGASRDDLAAMGFLTLGRRFLGVPWLIIDDRIDVVCRGTMGLTVGCARCHDHKYDAIPTADYYSLYGVFASSFEQSERLDVASSENGEFEKELTQRQSTLAQTLKSARAESSQRARSRVRDYLMAQTELAKYPPTGFDQVFSKDDLLPSFVHAWERTLLDAERNQDPVFIPWHAYKAIDPLDFSTEATGVTEALHKDKRVNRLVLSQFADPPQSFADVIDRYADLFEQIRDAAESEQFTGQFDHPEKEAIRQLLFAAGSPSVVPELPIVHVESFFDSGTTTELWKLQGEVDRWLLQAPQPVPMAVTLQDRAELQEPRVFIRGNPVQPGRQVPRRFLTVLGGSDEFPFQQGSGRLEFAQSIASADNPLTARVLVNRVWTHHFGQGLVSTPSDFGTRAESPSHPELLDWLAHWFIEHNWSLKNLHRLILTSATYRQSSAISDAAASGMVDRVDPDNRLLSRTNAHRLTFEEFRDSLLMVSSQLERHQGGPPADLFKAPYPKRRTLYGLVDRQYLPGTLRVFDFANPDLHIPQRPETTVPQQALFFLNHPMILEQVRAVAADLTKIDSPTERIDTLFQQVLQRNPTPDEVAEAVKFLRHQRGSSVAIPRPTALHWSYGYGQLDEAAARVKDFQPLPHFTGDAWQGGPEWPDAKLGWVQLTAEGGHPGNDRAHAAIRRWTAPVPGRFRIVSQLDHQPAAGDGIRSFLVSSTHGILDSVHVHQSQAELGCESIEVEAGETIDFVVDIGDVLNNDQYLWEIQIERLDDEDEPHFWNSKSDFTQDTTALLTPLEQLVHALVCTNEFLFVD